MKEAGNSTLFDPSMAGYKSHYMDVDGINTHYIEVGSGEPLVLIHGGGPGADCYGNWYKCLPEFAKNYHCFAVDMLGFGRTDKPNPENFLYSQDARTKHMTGFLQGLPFESVNLIGNSMGGLTSLCVARTQPELVKKLILMGAAGIKPSEISPALATLLSYDGTREGMRRVVDTLTHKEFEVDDALLDYRVELSLDPQAKLAQAAAMGWVKEQGGLFVEEDFIAGLTTPTFIIGGKNDSIVTPHQIFKFSELIEQAPTHLVPNCGHWVMMEWPEEFVDLSVRFLRS